MDKRHPASKEIKDKCKNLQAKWQKLLDASNIRAKVLEEAKDILKFNEEVDAVESWIRDKVGIIRWTSVCCKLFT